MRERVVLILGMLALMLGACSYLGGRVVEPYRPPAFQPVGDVTNGSVLYARDCAWCHGGSGQGTERAPNLNGSLDGGAYTDFVLRTGRMPLDHPDQPALPGPSRYSEEQIAAIVAHVKTFGGTGPDVPSPDPMAGDLGLGAELYLENCAACHSTTGIGGALTAGAIAPDLRDSTPLEVAEAMLVGPGCLEGTPTCGEGEGLMPRFDLTDEQINAVTRYVLYLQDARNRGGWPAGWVGPVAEGAVAWLIGLLALAVVIRWVGTGGEHD